MAFLEIFVSQHLLLFSKHLDTMSNVTDCGTGRTDLCITYIIHEKRNVTPYPSLIDLDNK